MRRLILQLSLLLTLSLTPALVVNGAAYADCPSTNSAKGQVAQGVVESVNDNCNDSGVTNVIGNVVNLLSYFVGIAAIFMIIFGGFKYITSGGDSGKVANAKNTLIYALVGVAVAALAQVLVHFVIFRANSLTTGGNGGASSSSSSSSSSSECVTTSNGKACSQIKPAKLQ